MVVKNIKYTDFDGVERIEPFYFNLNAVELMELDANIPGGFEQRAKNAVDSKNAKQIMDLFNIIIKKAYGEKSEDGRKLLKSEQRSEEFMQTNAYVELFTEFVTVPGSMEKFIKNIAPTEQELARFREIKTE